jgi:transcriptional regulator with XRE-family HTH domain
MPWHDSSARSRELGVELRKKREQAGLKGQELAAQLGWSASKVSRMESGTVAVSEVDAAIYLTYCGVHKDNLDEVLVLVRAPNTNMWLQERGKRLPEDLRTLIYHETTARRLFNYETGIVPGLLQTADYATAVFELAGVLPRERVPDAVEARMDRQSVLRRPNPPECVFYLHEHGLRSKIGSNQIMHEQLLQLVFLTARPQHQIRVVPAGAEPRSLGSFMLMGYESHGAVVYLGALTTSLFLEKPDHIEAYEGMLDRLDRAALDTGQSREWLARLASDFDQPEDGTDDEA